MSEQQWFRYKPRFHPGQRVRDWAGEEGAIVEVLERPAGEADYLWELDRGSKQVSQECELEEV